MIHEWGLEALQSGEGVIDIAGDPGFTAAELLRSNIPVTIVDPALGLSGKSDPMTTTFLSQFEKRGLNVIKKPFNQEFVEDPNHAKLLSGASALISLYPDEATDYCLKFTAYSGLRTFIIPCNECQQYFPPQNPTFEGFVQQCLNVDYNYSRYFGNSSLLKRERITNTPYCQVILQRTPGPPMPTQPPALAGPASR